MNDMKKMFQKEMKSSIQPVDVNGCEAVSESTSPPPASIGSDIQSAEVPPVSDGSIVSMTDVSFKYLKHVMFKFLTSSEYEVCLFGLMD